MNSAETILGIRFPWGILEKPKSKTFLSGEKSPHAEGVSEKVPLRCLSEDSNMRDTRQSVKSSQSGLRVYSMLIQSTQKNSLEKNPHQSKLSKVCAHS